MFDKKTHWEKIYREKSSSDVSWYQESPDLSLELICRSGVRNDEAIVDVGGGASVLVDVLCEEGFRNLSVLDISGIALAGAQQRLGGLAETIEWFEADITEFDPPHAFTLWHDRAVFHFLTDESDRRKYVNVLKRALRPGGHLIIAAFAIGGPEQCSGLQVVQYDSSRLKAELGEEFELVEERDEVHITPANKEQRFTYFRFVRKT
jgi:SAM-dependent methyltransferase